MDLSASALSVLSQVKVSKDLVEPSFIATSTLPGSRPKWPW